MSVEDPLCHCGVGPPLYDFVDRGLSTNCSAEESLLGVPVDVTGSCSGTFDSGCHLLSAMTRCLPNCCYGNAYIDSCLKAAIVSSHSTLDRLIDEYGGRSCPSV